MKSVDGLSESSLYRRRRTLKEFFNILDGKLWERKRLILEGSMNWRT